MSDGGGAERIEQIRRLNIASQPSGQPARRGQHPKHHGVVEAIFHVSEGIPPELRHGIFEHPRDYKAYVRFSNGRASDDRKADAHGMAIKLLGVSGEKLLAGRTQETAQDFVLVDSETFFTGDSTDYVLVNRSTMGKGLDKLFAWLSLLVRPALLVRIVQFVSKQPRSPFEIAYFSTVPFALGPQRVKYAALPRAPATGGPADGPDGLSEALRARLADCGVAFAFALDIQTDPQRQPIEDPTVAWLGAGAHRVVVAELIVPPQVFDPRAPIAENLQFSPWHALEAHRPLGFINEARGPVYRDMAKARHTRNQLVPVESSEVPESYTGLSAVEGV